MTSVASVRTSTVGLTLVLADHARLALGPRQGELGAQVGIADDERAGGRARPFVGEIAQHARAGQRADREIFDDPPARPASGAR